MDPKNTIRICSEKMTQWCYDLENVLKLFKRYPTNTTDRAGNTLLHYVTQSNDDNDEIIKYLIESGFEINIKNDKGETALINAVIRKNVKTVKILINSGAIVDHTYYTDHIGPLHYAAKGVCCEMLRILVDAGCNVNAKTKDSCTPLDYIIQNDLDDTVEVAKLLLDAGASRDHTYYKESIGPLHQACFNQDFNIVKLLLDSGFKASVKDYNEDTPLHWLFTERQFPYDDGDDVNVTNIAKLLIQAGANVNAKNDDNRIPLRVAVSFSYIKAFELLREAGSKLNAVDIEGDTVLHDAAYICNEDKQIFLMKRLIEVGVDINKVNNEGQSCIFNVVRSRCASVELLTLCIEHGAKLDLIDCNDMDLLSHALVRWGPDTFMDVSEWDSENRNQLLDYDATVEKRWKKDKIESQIQCIEILCKHGYDLNRVMKSGDSIFSVALKCYCHSKIIPALLRQGAIVNFNNSKVRRVMDKANFKSKLQRIIIQHAAMCNSYKKVKGIVNFNLKELSEEQVRGYENYLEELKNLKGFRVYESMSLLNLIEGPISSRFILNKHLIELFKTGLIAKSFPMFNEILTERFEREHEKYKLILKATAGLQTLIKFNKNSFPFIYDNILRYLESKDLHNLALLA